MRLSRWMMLIGALVGLGCLQVAQRTAIVLKSYAVGERLAHLHAQENEVAWLDAHVTGLGSPARLAEVAEERRLKLVAWSRLSPVPSLVGVMASESSPIHIASNDQDTSD